jgi:bifunctional DNA-binding transcriptional regulator/antitoxin component of YhaV-PrlF toxin-antitoxin module
LDAKARLVLPLSVRDRLNIKPKDLILLSVSSVSGEDKKITLVLAKAPEDSSGLAFSKNGSFLKKSFSKTSFLGKNLTKKLE